MFTKIVSLDTYCVHLSPEEINWNGVQKVTTGMTMKEHKRTIK